MFNRLRGLVGLCFIVSSAEILADDYATLLPGLDPENFPLTSGKPYCGSTTIREVYSASGEKLSSAITYSSEFNFYIAPQLRRKVHRAHREDGGLLAAQEFIYNLNGQEIQNSLTQGFVFLSQMTETGYGDLNHPNEPTYSRYYQVDYGTWVYNIKSESSLEYIYEENGTRPIQRISSSIAASGTTQKDIVHIRYADESHTTIIDKCNGIGDQGISKKDAAGHWTSFVCKKGDLIIGQYDYEYYPNGFRKSYFQEEHDINGNRTYFDSASFTEDSGETSSWLDDFRESNMLSRTSDHHNFKVEHFYERDEQGRVTVHRYQAFDVPSGNAIGAAHEVHPAYTGNRLTEITDKLLKIDGTYEIHRTKVDYSCLK